MINLIISETSFEDFRAVLRQDGKVSFRTLKADEFIRRFLLRQKQSLRVSDNYLIEKSPKIGLKIGDKDYVL